MLNMKQFKGLKVHTFEADKADHITAITVKLVPTTPVRDIKIDNFSVTFYGAELLQDTKLELSCGNR